MKALSFCLVGGLAALYSFSFPGNAARATSLLTIDWQRQMGTTVDDIAHAIAVDGSGNSYVGGETLGNLNGQTNFGSRDAFQLSLDAASGDRWTRLFGSFTASSDEVGNGVGATSSGINALTGLTNDVLFGSNSGFSDPFGVRINTTGGPLFGLQAGTTSFDNGQGVGFDGNSDMYYVGQTSGTSFLGEVGDGSSQAYIYKQTSSGSVPWARLLGTSGSEQAYDVAVAPNGNAALTGFTTGDLAATNAGANDVYVALYDTNGNPQWTKQIGSTGIDNAYGVAMDPSDNVYVTGDAGESIDGQTFSGGFSDAFVAKFDSSGTFQWARLLGDTGADTAQDIAVDAAGNSYIVGWTDGDIGGSNLGLTDTFLAKYDTNGNLKWTHQLGTGNRDEAEGIALWNNHIYITGTAFSSFAGQFQGGRDLFVIRFTEAPEPSTCVLALMALAALGVVRRRKK